MNDLISRLSEIRSNYNCFDETEEPYYRALSEAIQLASAQPEIIRCKECKHRNKDGECGQYDDGTVAVSCEVPDDHYCGYAERREE